MPNDQTAAAPDPVALTQALVRKPSVTPDDAGAMALLETALGAAGFALHRADRGGIANLYARFGDGGRVLGFAGHTDVVPPGDAAAWSSDPFSGALTDAGEVFGRGAVDMKSGVAAFVAAAIGAARDGRVDGSIALLITGDEEGDARDGTAALLDWMDAHGERLDACVVGEPASQATFGDQIKIGRRGSLTAHLTASGRQGHSAYPERACNPLPPLLSLLSGLAAQGLDDGTEHFQPSTLALTTVDVGNPANNVIPGAAKATLNIRYNTRHSARSLETWLRARIDGALAAAAEPDLAIALALKASGDAFLTEPGPLTELAAAAIEAETGARPGFSTGGGTSDARFIRKHCPVVEVGLVGRGMHQIDERVPAEEIRRLTRVYRGMIDRFFGASR